MKIVVLAEGMDEQLWPLSSVNRPKSLLPLLQNPEGAAESLLQRLWRQLQASDLGSQAFVTVSSMHADWLLGQLGAAARLIRLPQHGEILPSIALAASYLYSVAGAPLTEPLIVIRADLYLDDAKFDELIAALSELPGSGDKGFSALESIGGITAIRMNSLLAMLTSSSLPIPYEQLYRQFERLSESHMNKEWTTLHEDVLASLRADAGMSLVDGWLKLTEVTRDSQVGKGRIIGACHNSYLFNELNIPIAVVGLSNVIVAAGPNGILVTNRDTPIPFGQLADMQDNQSTYVERSWGSAQVLEHSGHEEQQVMIRRMTVKAGHNISCELHLTHKKVWTIVSGEGELLLDGTLSMIKPGDVVEIGIRKWHSMRANSELVYLEMQSGANLGEGIVLADEWDDIRSLMNQEVPLS